jgi:hypothetical protein
MMGLMGRLGFVPRGDFGCETDRVGNWLWDGGEVRRLGDGRGRGGLDWEIARAVSMVVVCTSLATGDRCGTTRHKGPLVFLIKHALLCKAYATITNLHGSLLLRSNSYEVSARRDKQLQRGIHLWHRGWTSRRCALRHGAGAGQYVQA